MAKTSLPDQSTLLEFLRYDAETGSLYWRPRTQQMMAYLGMKRSAELWNARYAEQPAFNFLSTGGYVFGEFGRNRSYKAHRVIWKMVTGEDPNNIDHLDGDRVNNRFANLRSVSHTENNRNQHRNIHDAQEGFGARRVRSGRWGASIRYDGKERWIGTADTREDAVRMREPVALSLGYAPTHGRRHENRYSAKRQALADMASEGLCVY